MIHDIVREIEHPELKTPISEFSHISTKGIKKSDPQDSM